MQTVVLKVSGMSCGGCSSAVATALESAGATEVSVTLEPPVARMTSSKSPRELIDIIAAETSKEAEALDALPFTVEGMSCQSCVGNVQSAAEKQGAFDVVVDLDANSATMRYLDDPVKLAEAITEASGKKTTFVSSSLLN